MKPDASSDSLERLIVSNEGLVKAIEANTAMQAQLLAGFRELQAALSTQVSSAVRTVPASDRTAAPEAQESVSRSASTEEPSDVRPTQEEFTGLIFTLFCHRGSGAYDQDLLRELLESRIPSLSFAVIYREGEAIGDKYTDKPMANPTRYWRVSLESKHLLLPCPAKPGAFYGVEGFEVQPPGSAVGPSTIELCLPASLKQEGDAWYIESKGQLSLRPGRWDRRDWEHLLNRQAGTLNGAASSAQPKVALELAASPANPLAPLPERLAEAYVSFCRESQQTRRSFADMQELWKKCASTDRIVAHRVVRKSDKLWVEDDCGEGKEHFWLVQRDGYLTKGWLFPCVAGNQFRILEPAYSGQDTDLSLANLKDIKPARISQVLTARESQPNLWRVEEKGELDRK